MASRWRGKRFAGIAALVASSLVPLWWWTRPDAATGSGRDGRGATAATGGASSGGGSRWLPWFSGGAGGADDAPAYHGPRVPVRVRVIDLEGRPVAGATVHARVDREEWETAGLSEEEYEEYLREKYGEPQLGREVPEDPWAATDDWPAAHRESVASGRTGRDGVYVAELKPHLDVVFQANDGSGREGVSATLYTYLIEEDATIDADEVDQFASAEDPFVVGGMFEVTIELAELSTLAGTVVDERGHPIGGAEVSITPWSGEVDTGEILASGEDLSGILTGDDGTFRVALRASGAFDVEVHAKGFQPVIEPAVQVLPGRETALNLTMLPSAEIAGVVLLPSGDPAAGARVMVQTASDVEYFSTEAAAGDDGRFVVEELAPGRYIVAGSLPGYRPAEQWETEAGTGRDVVLRLTAGGLIAGRVRADMASLLAARFPASIGAPAAPPDGPVLYGDVYVGLAGDPPLPGAPLDVGTPFATGVPKGREMESPSGAIDVRGRYVTQVVVDASGESTFEVKGLPPGSYDVTVSVGAAVGQRGGVQVYEGGSAQVFFELPDRSSATIAGRIRSADGRAISSGSVFLYGPDLPSGLSAWPDEEGTFEFRSVPPGRYVVHASAVVESLEVRDSLVSVFIPATEVTVPESGRVTLDLVAEAADVAIDVDPDAAAYDPDVDLLDLDAIDAELPVDDPQVLYMPDITIEDVGGRLVVTSAPAGSAPRLFGGDRVTSIDGASLGAGEAWELLERLYGPKGSLCAISVERPASGESFTVSLPRSRNAYELEGHHH